MKHLIIGTAGHVDHGKTALIKALTNIDCDTHKEEKRRGITINLGFAFLNLPSGDPVGIIDVPGHKDFIHTMVSGASGIDLVMLVIAADSGIMPQTIEHLNILEVLGVKKGMVVINKIDLVDEDLLTLAKDEIKSLLKNTFLEHAPVVEVSAMTGKGIFELKDIIAKVASDVEERQKGNFFRMFIDRIFTVKGFGSVVTGTVLNGEADASKKIYLLPGSKKELRIRKIERYGKPADKVVAGDRAAINLVGLERNDFKRGMIISDTQLQETSILDANLFIFKNAPHLDLWSKVVFHSGTFESQAKIHLINKDELKDGENAIAQIHLDNPCVLLHGDRFVIRNTSSDITLGGGEIVDTNPLHHRKRPPKLVDSMSKLAEGSIVERIRVEVKKKLIPVKAEQLADNLNKTVEEIIAICKENDMEDIQKYITGNSVILLQKERDENFYSRVIGNIKSFHKANSIFAHGLTADELKGKLGLSNTATETEYMELLLSKIEKDEHIRKAGNTWVLSEHKAAMSDEAKYQIVKLESKLLSYGMQAPLMTELEAFAYENRIQKEQLKQYLKYLLNARTIYFIENSYIHADIVNKCRMKLLTELNKTNKGITVSEFRELIDANRKMSLLLINLFDNEGVTLRKEDLRYITDKGKKLLLSKSGNS